MQTAEQKCIVVIEDNVTFLKMLKMRLEAKGYKAIVAEDGLEGLNLVRHEKPDLIICDLMLPGLDGHKITRMIKFDKGLQHIPVMMLTSRDLDEDMRLAKKCGADAFVVKTERAEVLMEKIKELLAKERSSTSVKAYHSLEIQDIG